MKVIVSACLAGVHCRYDCASQERVDIRKMVENGEALPVCPEQLGGLPTPREPSEIVGDKVLTINGRDVTAEFEKGAEEALGMALLINANEAYLKSRSPSCGHGKIYDGTFSGKLVEGDGYFTKLLKEKNIKVHSVD